MPITRFEAVTDGLEPANRRRDEYSQSTNLEDERLWIPYTEGAWFQACMFDVTNGGFANVLRILPGARLNPHYHIGTTHGYTLRGKWRYLEHDWVATPGTYIFEPPGELHTLVVPDDSPGPMMTFFHLSGGLIYIDNGNFAGYDDGFTLLQLARQHYRDVGLDPALLDKLIR